MGTNNSGHSQSDPGRSVDVNRAVAMVSLAVILILAVAIRLYGLNWDNGFAWTPHPDERAILSKVAIIHPPNLKNIDVLFDVEASPWNPRWFPYGSFPLYALKGVELLIELFSGFAICIAGVYSHCILARRATHVQINFSELFLDHMYMVFFYSMNIA